LNNDIIEKPRLSAGFPSQTRLAKGAVAIIECIQEIPCNPCETACRFNAIIVGRPITNLPKLLEDKCKGCGECISSCPGLAIFVVDMTFSADEAVISMPYEFHPLPKEKSVVDALDRYGNKVCEGKILRVRNHAKNDKTAVVSVIIDRKYADIVRNIRLKEK